MHRMRPLVGCSKADNSNQINSYQHRYPPHFNMLFAKCKQVRCLRVIRSCLCIHCIHCHFDCFFVVEMQVMIVHQWDSKAHSCRNHHVHYFHPPLLGHPWSQDEVARWEDIPRKVLYTNLMIQFPGEEGKQRLSVCAKIIKHQCMHYFAISYVCFLSTKISCRYLFFCQNICQPAGEKVCGLAGEQLFANSKAAWGCQTKKRR